VYSNFISHFSFLSLLEDNQVHNKFVAEVFKFHSPNAHITAEVFITVSNVGAYTYFATFAARKK
jgi:hypothetical protein